MIRLLDPAGLDREDAWTRIEERIRSAPLLVLLLDFDGTLAGIADRPEHVRLDHDLAETLVRLVRRPGVRVAVISGRALEDLRTFVPTTGLYLAGNHGIEMDGPTLHFVHPAAARRVGAVDALALELLSRLAPIHGTLIENKRFSIACHDRNVAPSTRATFWREIRGVLARMNGDWRFLVGKRVVEILPAIDWTKGSAARYLLSHLTQQSGESQAPFPIAIGDDTTDREMLEEVRSDGLGITVGRALGDGWDLELRDVAAVHRFLREIDRLRSISDQPET
jgi:trehalose-phosphatase